MYFAIGWPKHLDTASFGDQPLRQIACDRIKILLAILTDDTLAVWYCKPCVPIVSIRRTAASLRDHGANLLLEWKPDSNALCVATTDGTLLIYDVIVAPAGQSSYNQIDPPAAYLRRDSAELFVKDAIPRLTLQLVAERSLYVPVTCITCVNVTQMMVVTRSERILRIRWEGAVEDRDFSLDLKRIPFSINQQVSYAVPLSEANTFVVSCDYSPLVGGFAVVLNDGRAAYLTAGNLRFDPNQVQGIWAQGVEDATCASVNHKFRLVAFGRRNATAVVYTVDDVTGGLEQSHALELSAKDYTGAPGAVREMRWTPDGCAVAVSWANGGVSLWSTFGTMLMCSLGWDYGLQVDLAVANPLNVWSMDWSTEGYQLLMLRKSGKVAKEGEEAKEGKCALVQLEIVRSALTVNPCQSTNAHLFLQGDDKLYVNPGDSLQRVYHNYGGAGGKTGGNGMGAMEVDATDGDAGGYLGANAEGSAQQQNGMFAQSYNICTDKYVKGPTGGGGGREEEAGAGLEEYEVNTSLQVSSALSETKHWIVVQLPIAYMSTNWPIRYSAIDSTGMWLAAAGRTGVAVYSMLTRKWKLFGNERQEKDFLVTGGLLWWDSFLVLGCYSLEQQTDELRLYPRDAKLDNRFARVVTMAAPVMLINLFEEQLVVFTADGFVTVFRCVKLPPVDGEAGAPQQVDLIRQHAYDIRGLCVHPACIVSVTLTTLRNDGLAATRASQGNVLAAAAAAQMAASQPETIILNVSGRILMVNRETAANSSGQQQQQQQEQLTSTCLASCVECLWVSTSRKTHLRESLWLWCGGHGMRVWLPVFPRGDRASGHGSSRHTFMSRRIMLSFQLRVYPLAILFEDAIILGAENDTTLYTSDVASAFSVPFCFLKKTSQVYLHQILRQLIRRNLGYNAWEIAGSCTALPYFPHSLELLLHEVLEEEATSKEPIPDALLPSVLEFIQEFPVYLQTVVQCARKTEIALWPYLFASAGKPKELFQQCLQRGQLETAASYLIILQNLEPSSVSRQYATILLETALEQRKWELAKDLVRFLRAIDPNDVESPRQSFVMGAKLGPAHHHHHHVQASAGGPNAEELSLILGTTMQQRGRSYSTTQAPQNVQSPQQNPSKDSSGSAEAAAMSPANSASATGSHAGVVRRKKSSPQTAADQLSTSSPASANNTAEEFFIEVILQRHARKLLQEKKLEALGYMSAALDFHLVGWLARERDRAARVEDFVQTLKQLHSDLDWPKPNLDLRLGGAQSAGQWAGATAQRRGTDTSTSSLSGQVEPSSPTHSLQSLRIDQQQLAGAGTDSGYTSLPALAQLQLSSAAPSPATEATPSNVSALYNPDLSTAALQSMSARFGQDLCRISEEGGGAESRTAAAQRARRSGAASVLSPMETEARLQTRNGDCGSVASECPSLWTDDMALTDSEHMAADRAAFRQQQRAAKKPAIPAKLEVKVRYLLQLFTEAACLDLALLLSVLLLDAASVGRIVSAAVRGGSLGICRQLRNGLKDMTRWSFAECLGYRPFMLQLQAQVGVLDQFVLREEQIPMFGQMGGEAAMVAEMQQQQHQQFGQQSQPNQQQHPHRISLASRGLSESELGAMVTASRGKSTTAASATQSKPTTPKALPPVDGKQQFFDGATMATAIGAIAAAKAKTLPAAANATQAKVGVNVSDLHRNLSTGLGDDGGDDDDDDDRRCAIM